MNKRKLVLIMAASLVVLAAGATFVGCLAAGEPQAKSSARPTSSPAHPDPGGKSACDMVENMREGKSWDDYSFALNIVKAAKTSSNSDISNTAVIVELRLAIAVASQGQPEQPEKNTKLRESLEDFDHRCQMAGLL